MYDRIWDSRRYWNEKITSDQAARWAFGTFFVPFDIPKIIVVDADGLFAVAFKNTFQVTLLIPVHAVSIVNHKAIRNEGFRRYLDKVHNINSADKGSLHQRLKGVFFALYAWNAFPVDGTDIAQSLMAIGIELPFPIDLSPANIREGTSEVKQALDHFEASSPLLFRQRDLFNILVSERRMRHRELRNKGKLMREFDTGDLVIVSKQVKSSRKYEIAPK